MLKQNIKKNLLHKIVQVQTTLNKQYNLNHPTSNFQKTKQ